MANAGELRQTAGVLGGRRERVAGAWGLTRGTVLVASGLPLPIAGTDQYHDFHAHNEHRYLSGTDVPGSVLAFDPGEGWTLFAPVATVEERVWVGDGVRLDELAAASGVERVRAADELGGWLERRRGEPLALMGNDDFAHQPGGYGVEGWTALEMEVDEELSGRLSEQVAELRRAKDGDELALMREAARISEVGHRTALRLARPGMTERQIQVELEAAFFREGSERTAYGSIVGTGANGAVLHFSPTKRVVRDGEIILIDAGAEYGGYASDVTRTFPAGTRFSGIQRELYELVLRVQEAAIADVRPGKEYRELHLEASRRIAEGLVEAGILRGDADGLVEQDAHALFFPHGLGHMLGLATHDAGGCLAGRTPSDRFGLKYLRADLPLEAGYVVTVEPGIYFIRALLEDAGRRERYRDAVNWERVDGLLDFGGIRIEDDVLVTERGAEVLSGGLPKDVRSIEELRREGLEG
jgi:Xaa-Pro aminopeptidase